MKLDLLFYLLMVLLATGPVIAVLVFGSPWWLLLYIPTFLVMVL